MHHISPLAISRPVRPDASPFIVMRGAGGVAIRTAGRGGGRGGGHRRTALLRAGLLRMGSAGALRRRNGGGRKCW